ncbi:hypothetical protein, partial [Escherichia coli]|uniref:hypothetical protein n=1 Tax=Escherichia coli TaxID=562 RepID=UPI0019CFA431
IFLAHDYRFANILFYIHHQMIIKIVNNFLQKTKSVEILSSKKMQNKQTKVYKKQKLFKRIFLIY